MISNNSRIQCESLFANYQNLKGKIFSITQEYRHNSQVKDMLQEHSIQLGEVAGNIEHFLQIIDQDFRSKRPRSSYAVASVLEMLNKTVESAKPEVSAEVQASILLALQFNLKYFLKGMYCVWTYEDDIAAFPNLDNPQYQAIYEKITVVDDPNPQKSQEQIEKFKKKMIIVNAAVISQLNQSNAAFGLIAFGLSFPRFAISYDSALLRYNVFVRNPNIATVLQMWNLPQKGAIKKLKYLQFDTIQVNRMLYFPKYFRENHNIHEISSNSIPVRVLNNFQIEFQEDISSSCSCSSKKVGKQINEIILHFHGGGFVSLSSCTTQSFTRRWARSLNIPVLSVDYSMPPEHRFPEAVKDALAVYRFIVTELPQLCNIKPKKIVLAGDSAGGNLVCSLMGLILREKLPVPSGICLIYPAASLLTGYSPSRIHAFFAPILHPSLLDLCLKEYLGPEYSKQQTNILASPLFLTNQFIGEGKGDMRFPTRWPKTRIMVGDLDPLFDDSLRLCQRMVESGVDVNCRVYRNMGHAFLSLEKEFERGEQAIIESIQMIWDCFT